MVPVKFRKHDHRGGRKAHAQQNRKERSLLPPEGVERRQRLSLSVKKGGKMSKSERRGTGETLTLGPKPMLCAQKKFGRGHWAEMDEKRARKKRVDLQRAGATPEEKRRKEGPAY